MYQEIDRIKKLSGLQENDVIDRPPVQSQQEIELNKPGGFNIVALNDPVTPVEVVVEAIMSVIGLSAQQAFERVMTAHRGGWSVVATYASGDVAETKANQLNQHAKNNSNYDHYRTMPGIPRSPRGPGGHQGPWPITFEVMEAG